jgi:hypothetical protein
VIEVFIAGVQEQIVLEDDSGYPNIICRNRRPSFSELLENSCIMMGGLIIGENDPDSILLKKATQHTLVLSRPATMGKPGPKFGDYDKG